MIFTWKPTRGKTTGCFVRHTRTSIHYLQIRLQSRLTASHLRLLIRLYYPRAFRSESSSCLQTTKRQIQDLTLNEEIKQPSVNMCNIQDAQNARLDILAYLGKDEHVRHS